MRSYFPDAQFPLEGPFEEVTPEKLQSHIDSGGGFVIEAFLFGDPSQSFAQDGHHTAWAWKDLSAEKVHIEYSKSPMISLEEIMSGPIDANQSAKLDGVRFYYAEGNDLNFRFFVPS